MGCVQVEVIYGSPHWASNQVGDFNCVLARFSICQDFYQGLWTLNFNDFVELYSYDSFGGDLYCLVVDLYEKPPIPANVGSRVGFLFSMYGYYVPLFHQWVCFLAEPYLQDADSLYPQGFCQRACGEVELDEFGFVLDFHGFLVGHKGKSVLKYGHGVSVRGCF